VNHVFNASCALALAVLGGVSCANVERKGYLVSFYIQGSPSAFRGRDISVATKRVPDAVPVDSTGELLETYVELCSANRNRFLEAPIRVVVRQGSSVVDDVQVERIACRDASTPGHGEEDHIVIDDEGHVLHEFGNGDRVWATCYSHPSMYPCPADDF
jgi:hypothetical protein